MAGSIEDTDRPPPTGEAADGWPPSLDHDLDPVQQAVLEQDTRREIVALLAEVPGLNKTQTARQVGIARRTLDEHLRLLQAANLVVVKPSDRAQERLCFLAKHEHLWEDEATRVLYGEAPVRDVALALVDHEPCRSDTLASIVDRSSRTVRDHLAELRDRGLSGKVRSSGTVFHVASGSLRAWVDEWGDSYETAELGED